MTESKPPSPREIEEAYVRMVEIMRQQERHAADIAHSRRTLYLAYIDEGFTPEQALELCARWAG